MCVSVFDFAELSKPCHTVIAIAIEDIGRLIDQEEGQEIDQEKGGDPGTDQEIGGGQETDQETDMAIINQVEITVGVEAVIEIEGTIDQGHGHGHVIGTQEIAHAHEIGLEKEAVLPKPVANTLKLKTKMLPLYNRTKRLRLALTI